MVLWNILERPVVGTKQPFGEIKTQGNTCNINFGLFSSPSSLNLKTLPKKWWGSVWFAANLHKRHLEAVLRGIHKALSLFLDGILARGTKDITAVSVSVKSSVSDLYLVARCFKSGCKAGWHWKQMRKISQKSFCQFCPFAKHSWHHSQSRACSGPGCC